MGGGAARRKLIIAAFTLVTLSIYVTMQTVQQFMPARSARVYGKSAHKCMTKVVIDVRL